MPAVKVLLEVFSEQSDPFAKHSAALESAAEAEIQAVDLLSSLDGMGIELDEDVAPVPMFSTAGGKPAIELEAFSAGPVTAAVAPSSSTSVVIPAEVNRSRLDALRTAPNVKVWPNSEMVFFAAGDSVFDDATSRGGLDCRPFRSAVEIETIRTLLGVDLLWADGFRGQNTVVGIIDEV
jgi:serine protease AprX